MPPKTKKDKKRDDVSKKEPKEERATERELLLEKELNGLTEEVEQVKTRVRKLKDENEFLEEEAQKVSNESQEYMSYMTKKANMRQNSIVTLSDQNRKEIENINGQKEEVLKDFEMRKKTLQSILLEKQHLLNKVNRDLEEMSEYKQLKTQQADEIEALDDEMTKLRAEQSKTITELKARFLQDTHEIKRESDAKIQTVIKAANKEARQCLNENTMKIKYDNYKLRKELLELIQNTKALHAHKEKLDSQRNEIQQEISYAEDLKKLRTNRQDHVLQKLFGQKD